MAQLNMRLDDQLKKESSEIFDSLGMDLTTGIKIYLTKVVREKGIPFDLTLPQSDFEEALRDIESGNHKTFSSKDNLLKELNNGD